MERTGKTSNSFLETLSKQIVLDLKYETMIFERFSGTAEISLVFSKRILHTTLHVVPTHINVFYAILVCIIKSSYTIIQKT